MPVLEILIGIAIVVIMVATIGIISEKRYLRKTNDLWQRLSEQLGGEFRAPGLDNPPAQDHVGELGPIVLQ